MDNIRSLTLNDREIVSSYLGQFPPQISEHTFTNLYVWRHSRTVFFTEAASSLFFLLESPGDKERYVLFGPPVGPTTPDQAALLLGESFAGAIRIPAGAIQTENSVLRLKEDRANADYVYLRSNLADLEGRRYAKKRNLIKQCLKKFRCEYEPLTPALLEECSAMQERWCDQRECDHDPGLCSEFIAIKETIKHFEELGIFGGAIRINGAIEAYAMEKGTAQFYRFAASRTDLPSVRELLKRLGRWEDSHMEYLAFLHRSFQGDLDLASYEEYSNKLEAEHMESGVPLAEALTLFQEEDCRSTPAVLSLALKIEGRAYAHYDRLSREAGDVNASVVFAEMKAQEQRHVDLLKEQNLVLSDLRTRYREQIMVKKAIDYRVGAQISVTPPDITKYYNEHLEDYTQPEQVAGMDRFVRTRRIVLALGVVDDYLLLATSRKLIKEAVDTYHGSSSPLTSGRIFKDIDLGLSAENNAVVFYRPDILLERFGQIIEWGLGWLPLVMAQRPERQARANQSLENPLGGNSKWRAKLVADKAYLSKNLRDAIANLQCKSAANESLGFYVHLGVKRGLNLPMILVDPSGLPIDS